MGNGSRALRFSNINMGKPVSTFEIPRATAPHPWARLPYFSLALLCLAGVVYGSLLPFNFDAPNLKPGVTLMDRLITGPRWVGTPLDDLVTNILLYMPAAMLLRLGLWRCGRGMAMQILLPTGLAFAISYGLETGQIFLPATRVSSMNDVLLNGAGGLVGVLLAVKLHHLLRWLCHGVMGWFGRGRGAGVNAENHEVAGAAAGVRVDAPADAKGDATMGATRRLWPRRIAAILILGLLVGALLAIQERWSPKACPSTCREHQVLNWVPMTRHFIQPYRVALPLLAAEMTIWCGLAAAAFLWAGRGGRPGGGGSVAGQTGGGAGGRPTGCAGGRTGLDPRWAVPIGMTLLAGGLESIRHFIKPLLAIDLTTPLLAFLAAWIVSLALHLAPNLRPRGRRG